MVQKPRKYDLNQIPQIWTYQKKRIGTVEEPSLSVTLKDADSRFRSIEWSTVSNAAQIII